MIIEFTLKESQKENENSEEREGMFLLCVKRDGKNLIMDG